MSTVATAIATSQTKDAASVRENAKKLLAQALWHRYVCICCLMWHFNCLLGNYLFKLSDWILRDYIVDRNSKNACRIRSHYTEYALPPLSIHTVDVLYTQVFLCFAVLLDMYPCVWHDDVMPCRCDTSADDIKNITSKDQVEKLASQIEEALYALHNDITTKYKTKYRSLLFNLRDPKNQVSNNI